MSERKVLVIKIGSSSLTDPTGALNRAAFLPFALSIFEAKKKGIDVIVVSSGAIAAGRGLLGITRSPKSITEKQALAALGQGHLIKTWSEAFQWHNINVGQLLLTRNDLAFKESYQNILGCLNALLEKGIVPIINENDSVRVHSRNFGDNDMLGALIAALVRAEAYIIFTDTAGLFDKNPVEHKDAKPISFVEDITDEIMDMTGGVSQSNVGTGGMRTKLEAVRRAISQGIPCFIGIHGGSTSIEDIIANKGQGTYFGSQNGSSLSLKKQWMLFHSEIQGQISIDQGAKEALLHKGKSLLPVGVLRVIGDFPLGAMIEVFGPAGELLGRGRSSYGSEQLKRVLGSFSSDAKAIANAEREEVIHRDDWVEIYE